ncbi:hypothetical protein BUALT_Bualt04G0001200 [Buddleja alternifolia]|uniref:Uncharacterized protein n=1 Tax=Buddleja alternifolia TaxID=168488 RepID=A0AAV6XSP1_9LAMI|nr:hypothetical protein BUALT_Bualt04G0001200 [Buddleja alternifolia]
MSGNLTFVDEDASSGSREEPNNLDGHNKHNTPHSGRRKRSRKATGDAIVDAMLEIAAASKMRAAAIMRNEERFTISKCIRVLDEMQGVDQSIYFYALDLFENASARETFMALKGQTFISQVALIDREASYGTQQDASGIGAIDCMHCTYLTMVQQDESRVQNRKDVLSENGFVPCTGIYIYIYRQCLSSVGVISSSVMIYGSEQAESDKSCSLFQLPRQLCIVVHLENLTTTVLGRPNMEVDLTFDAWNTKLQSNDLN